MGCYEEECEAFAEMSDGEREDRELQDEEGGAYGDPRRCPFHPHVVTSSPDGMFDAPCDECEHAGEEELAAEEYAAQQADPLRAECVWDDKRIVCGQSSADDEIPF
jgi:hypothetical protein